ncbi:MAG: HEAT repeat domain-containing protein [Gemmatimonadales bacterium]|nr:HEAT repeat domain-containing protein [Gemmatimonadales bacterium]
MLAFLVCLVATLAASPVQAQSGDFDLLHQRIEVARFDWDSLAFDGRVTSTLVSRRDGLEVVTLAMRKQLRVRTVTGPRRLGFSRPGDSIAVRLAHPAVAGDTLRITIAYRGRVEQGRGLYFFTRDPRPRRTTQVYSGGGTDGNFGWFPTVAEPDDKATWDLIATVPKALTVVSNGRQLSDRPARGRRHTVHWRQERPASTYLISLVAAPLARVRDGWRDTPLDYYVPRGDSALARPLFGITPDLIETYGRLLGVPYPWNKYAQTSVIDFIGGMENVSATTLVDWLPDARAYADRPWFQWLLIPHELAHQWFGDLVTAKDWSHYWLNEGIAEFMPGQYWAEKQGPHAADDYYLNEYLLLLDRDARRRAPLVSYNSNIVYQKGALVLRMLQAQLGPARFWAGMRAYLTRHAWGNATTDDLRTAFESVSGDSLAWFWEQWMYAAGHPEFRVSARYDSGAHAVLLIVRQAQVDTAAADSTGARVVTPAVFRAPLTVRVGTREGDVVANVMIDRRQQEVRIGGVRSPPTMIVFDDGSRILKTLAFAQPTAWLAAQLARDPDLWNRWWVIQQLAGRRTDPLAAGALLTALDSADYPLTRAQAASALRAFPPRLITPGLVRALADTSSAVRVSAAVALGRLGGSDAVAAIRTTWKGDTSYEVRAAALGALARLDPDGARPDILAGLASSSYRDVIQTAAILATLRRPDSALVAGVANALGDQDLAAEALVALASRGDPVAREALVRHQHDPRPWVRRWVAEAMGESVAEGSR